MNFINFKGKKIFFKYENSTNWIMLKSVCEAIGVNWNRQWQNIKEDTILKPKYAKQHIQIDKNSQSREYICLPEEYVYGWVFSIRSESPELLIYKDECYHVLFNHFHGVIKDHAVLYQEIVKEKKRKKHLIKKLIENQDYIEYLDSKMREARLWKSIRNVTNDITLFDD